MLKVFKGIAILEGISYLALFGFSMPLKHWANIPEPNKWIGYAHGFLFIAYIILAVLLFVEKKWGLVVFIKIVVASLLPFGAFYIEKKYIKTAS